MAEMEAMRMLVVKRGNLQKELSHIGEESSEGTEIQNVTLFKLMKAFERVIQRLQEKQNRPVHTVVQYEYTMDQSRDHILHVVQEEKVVSFEKIFSVCENRIYAIFLFLSMLELIQEKYMNIMVGEGMNNFILEFNENRPIEEQIEQTF